MQIEKGKKKARNRLDVVSITSFVLAIMFFSGAFSKATGFWRIFDLQTLTGSFGVIAEGAKAGIVGTGGYGAKEGFFQSINMAPAVILAVALINLVDNYGGLRAAQKLLTPILKPLLGVRGSGAIPIITNWQSSDAMAAYLGDQVEKGGFTTRERDIIATYGFMAAGTIGVFYSNCALLFPYITVAPGAILAVVMVTKFIGGNLMRLYLHLFEKDSGKGVWASGAGE